MKVLLFTLFCITVFLFNFSIEQTRENPEDSTTTTTTTWNTTGLPTTTQRPIPQKKTTTAINRVSTPVLIAVPVAIAGATLLIGFGLIAYAVRTGGNGVFFLTRTNERLLP